MTNNKPSPVTLIGLGIGFGIFAASSLELVTKTIKLEQIFIIMILGIIIMCCFGITILSELEK